MKLHEQRAKQTQAELTQVLTINDMEKAVIAMLQTIYDPEIPVNIYDLGLIYKLSVNPGSGHVDIQMTLTAPGCPVAHSFPGKVAETVGLLAGVEVVEVELVWDPPWSKARMSEAARLELGLL